MKISNSPRAQGTLVKYLLPIVLIAGFSLFALTGCNQKVPQGYKAKILTPSGFAPEIYKPSLVFVGWRENLILIETTTKVWKEQVNVLLQDKLTLTANVNFRARITSDPKKLNALFNDIPVADGDITVDEVYKVYAQMLVRSRSREVLSVYTVDDVNKNYKRISVEIYNALQEAMKNTPIDISDVTLDNIQYPKIVTQAIEKAKQRRMEIEAAKAEAQKELVKIKAQEEIALANYKIKMLEAKRIRDYNKMVAEGVTDDLIRLRELEVKEKMVDAIQNNKNVIYMPLDMMKNINYMKSVK